MKYPNKKVTIHENIINYKNRGLNLEDDINNSNKYYLEKDIAVIYKKPTPIKVVKVDYNNRVNTVIKEAYYEIPSTTDYNGIYKGKYIDFEAKETQSKTSFALKNIHAHQIKHLISILNHGGISFLIIRFCKLNKTFLFETSKLELFMKNNNRKSIPISYIEENGYIIKEGYYPRLDYILIVDKLLGDAYEKEN